MANREEQLKQITEQLEQGVAEIFTSEKIYGISEHNGKVP